MTWPARTATLAPAALVVCAATIAVIACLQALRFPFIMDDVYYLQKNTQLAGLGVSGLWQLLVRPYNLMAEFLPLRDFSYWLDLAWFGLTPTAFRTHNIVLYLLCLPLVYGCTTRLWRYFQPDRASDTRWIAATVTALFALHPAHVEAVVWISGRKDLLSGLFSLLALWLALAARREQGFSWPHVAGASLALLAAMLSKASAIAVAPIIVLLWILFWRDVPAAARRVTDIAWFAVAMIPAGIAASLFEAVSTNRPPSYFGIESVNRTLAIQGWLARLSLSPEARHFFHPVFEQPGFSLMAGLGATVLAVAAVAAAGLLMRWRTLAGFAIVAFVLLCAPYLQLLPYTPPSLVSDRFIFLAVWPILMLVVALAWRLPILPRIAFLLALALPWMAQTAVRPGDWINTESLSESDLRTFPGYYMPATYKTRKLLFDKKYAEAAETASRISDPQFRDIMAETVSASQNAHVQASADGHPKDAMARLWALGSKLQQLPHQAPWNLTLYNLNIQCMDEIRNSWQALVKHFPDDMTVRYNAGLSLLRMQLFYDEAAYYFSTAVNSQRLPPEVRGMALKNLGLALLRSGKVRQAEAPLLAALQQNYPEPRAHCVLAKVYEHSGRSAEAVRAQALCAGSAAANLE